MIVLDCDAAVALVLGNDDGKALAGLMNENELVICPQLFFAELINALSKYIRAGKLDIDVASSLLQKATSYVDEFVDMRENYNEALDEGVRNSHSTYDMFYLTLARRNGATLFTLNRRLIALCEKLGVDCVHILPVEAKPSASQAQRP
jgi:predicted nucleic acid-binding protein